MRLVVVVKAFHPGLIVILLARCGLRQWQNCTRIVEVLATSSPHYIAHVNPVYMIASRLHSLCKEEREVCSVAIGGTAHLSLLLAH